MANFLTHQLIGPLLVSVCLLHISKISALKCYACTTVPDNARLTAESCLKKNLQQQSTFVEDPTSNLTAEFSFFSELLTNWTISNNVEMLEGPSCYTHSSFAKSTKKIKVVRYIYPEIPKNLDKYGCTETNDPKYGDGKTCFCKTDKCNNDTIDLTPLHNAQTSSSKVSFLSPSFFLIASFVMLLTNHP